MLALITRLLLAIMLTKQSKKQKINVVEDPRFNFHMIQRLEQLLTLISQSFARSSPAAIKSCTSVTIIAEQFEAR